MTLASRLLGVVREMCFSHFFGAGYLLSGYRVAFQIPNLGRRLFGEGALTAAFIPIFTDCRHNHGDDQARKLAGAVLTLLSVVLLAVVIIVELVLIAVIQYRPSLTLSLTIVLLPYMVLICVTAFFAGLLNVLGRFAAPAFAPIILNVAILAGTWVGGAYKNLDPHQLMYYVAASVLIAGVLQVGMQVAWLRAIGFRPRINFDWSNPTVRKILAMMGPMVIGLSAVQINTFADSLIALYFVADGKGPAVLGYAQYLSNLPLGVFATALATAIFPLLSQNAASRDYDALSDNIQAGLRTSLFITVPAAVGLIVLAEPTVRVLFERGRFTSADTSRVVAALIFYSLGLWAYASQHILIRAFYSMGDGRTPVRIAIGSVILNLVLNLILVRQMREAGVALATAITASIQACALAGALKYRLSAIRWSGVLSSAGRSCIAAAAMATLIIGLRAWPPVDHLLSPNDWTAIGVSILLGATCYFALARILRLDELSILFRQRNRNAHPVD